jgi:predicted RNA-binding protein with PUA-like domain
MAKRAAESRQQRFWLIKSDPSEMSFDELWTAPKRTTGWDGVRNYQARNFLREMAPGDGVLFYQSGAEPSGVVGLAEVASAAQPDPTQFVRGHAHFDPRSKREEPTWLQVEVRAVAKLARVVALAELKANPALAQMRVVQKGSRLSIQPVTAAEWQEVVRMAAAVPRKSP